MTGSMRRRGAGWELKVYLGRDPLSGKERYATKTFRGGKREAQRALNEMVVEADRGQMARSDATVGELLDQWLDLARADFSPKTVRETGFYIERNLRPALGQVRLNKLTPAAIDRYYRGLLVDGGKGGRPLAPATIKRIHGVLRRALTQGVRWGWLGVNPAMSATPPRVPTPEVRPPTPEELGRLLTDLEVKQPDLATYVRLAAMTGARRSELIALRWNQIDLERGFVLIGRGIVMGPDGLVEKDTKTHQVRRVAIDETTVRTLIEHRSEAVRRSRRCDVELCADAFVFSDAIDGGACWVPDSLSHRFRIACRSAGIEGVRLHDLRHYVATTLLGAGVDVRTVAGRLGHRNAATTLNVYAHFLPEADRDAAVLLGRINAGGVSRPERSARAAVDRRRPTG